jgi:hypothetical protein
MTYKRSSRISRHFWSPDFTRVRGEEEFFNRHGCLQQSFRKPLFKESSNPGNRMNLKDIQQTIASLQREQQTLWLIDLGWAMTVAARGGYPLAQQADHAPHLMAFNEMQHQLFNYLRDSGSKDDWTIEAFLDGLCQKAKVSGVERDFGWALNWTLERLASRQ